MFKQSRILRNKIPEFDDSFELRGIDNKIILATVKYAKRYYVWVNSEYLKEHRHELHMMRFGDERFQRNGLKSFLKKISLEPYPVYFYNRFKKYEECQISLNNIHAWVSNACSFHMYMCKDYKYTPDELLANRSIAFVKFAKKVIDMSNIFEKIQEKMKSMQSIMTETSELIAQFNNEYTETEKELSEIRLRFNDDVELKEKIRNLVTTVKELSNI